jgi:hypothetical protein
LGGGDVKINNILKRDQENYLEIMRGNEKNYCTPEL